ncbi:hypothetical protein EDB89DRAFT_1964212 [Lactarius sanguifluus]|nr:hypothetical protein EDB89DRAFT_1964212 [Lactarius sanguifluus]
MLGDQLGLLIRVYLIFFVGQALGPARRRVEHYTVGTGPPARDPSSCRRIDNQARFGLPFFFSFSFPCSFIYIYRFGGSSWLLTWLGKTNL